MKTMPPFFATELSAPSWSVGRSRNLRRVRPKVQWQQQSYSVLRNRWGTDGWEEGCCPCVRYNRSASLGEAVLRVTTVFASSFGCFGTAVRTSKQFKGWRRSSLSFERYTDERHKMPVLRVCTLAHKTSQWKSVWRPFRPFPAHAIGNAQLRPASGSHMPTISANHDVFCSAARLAVHRKRFAHAAQTAFLMFAQLEGKREAPFVWKNVGVIWATFLLSLFWLVTHVSRKFETTSKSIGI